MLGDRRRPGRRHRPRRGTPRCRRSTPPAVRCGRPSARASRRRPATRCDAAAPTESRWVRISAVPWAWAARRLNSMRRAHVFGRPVGRPVGADRVERAHEGAVGVGLARPDVALVEMGVHVDEGRPDHAADRGRAAASSVSAAGRGDDRSTRPSATTMSTAQRPSASGSAAGIVEQHAGHRGVGDRRSAAASGLSAKPRSAMSVLPAHGALVPLPREEMRDEAGGGVDHHAGQATAAPAPRRGAGC